MVLKYLVAPAFYLVYEGDDTVVGGAGGNDEVNETLPGGGGDDDIELDIEDELKDNKTFTKAELNKILFGVRKKNRTQVERTVKELETIKKSKTLTEQEKAKLQGRIDDLNNTLLTREQLAAKEKEKIEATHKQTVQSLTAERDTWQNRFINSQINTAIISEAVNAEAFNPDDLIALLGPKTRLSEDKDEEGKSLDSFTPKVKFNDTDADGKPITLDMTVDQTIKRMKEMPKFAHLFKSTAVGGIGANNNAGKGGSSDFNKGMTPEQYRIWRKKNIKKVP